MQFQSRSWLLTCLSAALMSAPLAYAQSSSPAAAEPSLPERVVEELGGAIRGLFRSIFGEREGELPGAPARSRDADHMPPRGTLAPAATPPQAADDKAAKPVVAVTATPAATAAPQSLHAAIAKGDYSEAMKMIEQGTDIESKDPGAGASALHYAVMKGTMPMVGLLLQRGADVNSRTKSGTTPLHTAVLYGHFDVAEYLLEKGAEVNAKSSSGATPLSLALAANFQRIEKLLRGKGAN